MQGIQYNVTFNARQLFFNSSNLLKKTFLEKAKKPFSKEMTSNYAVILVTNKINKLLKFLVLSEKY